MTRSLSPTIDVAIAAFGRTDVGHVREHNEDAFLMGDLTAGEPWSSDEPLHIDGSGRGPLFVVCDGLGGAASGEVASQMASQIIWDEMLEAQETDERVIFARLLRRAVRVANRCVWDRGRKEKKHRGMGTTVSAAGFVDNALIFAQVGDSRAYIMRRGELFQATADQSVVSALVGTGRVTENLAQHLPESNMVLQALGVRRDVEVALSVVELRRNDTLLLCTDGLHSHVDRDTIIHLLDTYPDVEQASEQLIEAANRVGAPDNVTAIVVRFSGEALDWPTDGDRLVYAEMDPMEEGERSLIDSSLVTRRLAARVGIGEDPGPPVVPATSQFSAMRREEALARKREEQARKEGSDKGKKKSKPRDLRPWATLAIVAVLIILAAWAVI